MHCPNCKKTAHTVCDNKKCACWQRMNDNELPLIYKWKFYKFTIPQWTWLWHIFSKYITEIEQCPYCGYYNSPDGWSDIALKQLFKKHNVNSFTELAEKLYQ